MNTRFNFVPLVITGILLLAALGHWPYGYYKLLRFVVCGVGAYTAYTAYNQQKIWAVWVFGFIAVLFNPLIPIHLSREIWQPIDIVCALLFTGVVFILTKPNK